MRAFPCSLPYFNVDNYDYMCRLCQNSFGCTLGGDIGDDGGLAVVFDSGLGIRRASDVALLAFSASRTAAWAAVKSIFKDLHAAGLADFELLRTSYITRTYHAQMRFEASSEADVRDYVRT